MVKLLTLILLFANAYTLSFFAAIVIAIARGKVYLFGYVDIDKQREYYRDETTAGFLIFLVLVLVGLLLLKKFKVNQKLLFIWSIPSMIFTLLLLPTSINDWIALVK